MLVYYWELFVWPLFDLYISQKAEGIIMVKSPVIYKSYMLRLCLSNVNGIELERIRLENVAEEGEVHHFTNIDDMVNFLMETLQPLRPQR